MLKVLTLCVIGLFPIGTRIGEGWYKKSVSVFTIARPTNGGSDIAHRNRTSNAEASRKYVKQCAVEAHRISSRNAASRHGRVFTYPHKTSTVASFLIPFRETVRFPLVKNERW